MCRRAEIMRREFSLRGLVCVVQSSVSHQSHVSLDRSKNSPFVLLPLSCLGTTGRYGCCRLLFVIRAVCFGKGGGTSQYRLGFLHYPRIAQIMSGNFSFNMPQKKSDYFLLSDGILKTLVKKLSVKSQEALVL